MDLKSKKNKTGKQKITIQLNKHNPSDLVIFQYLMDQKNVAGCIKLCLLEKALQVNGHGTVGTDQIQTAGIRIANSVNSSTDIGDFGGAY
jgi:hypothetical protein